MAMALEEIVQLLIVFLQWENRYYYVQKTFIYNAYVIYLKIQPIYNISSYTVSD